METAPGPDRNLAMELMRATEAAALAGRPLDGPRRQERRRRRRGRGDARRAQHASRWTASSSSARARRTKRRCSSTASRSATARAPSMDIAVDPIDGTTLTSLGRNGAIAVIAMSERGTMFDPGPCVYMEKIAAGPSAADVDRPQRAGEGEPRSGRQGARREGQRRDRGRSSTATATPTSSASAARPAPASASSPTATSPARSRSRGATPAPTSCSASAARPKA